MNFGAANAVLIIFGLIILVYVKQKIPSGSSRKTNINEDIMRLNILIDRYNSMIQLFLSDISHQKEKAQKYCDTESLKDILIIENNFYTSQYTLVSLLEELKQSISNSKRTDTVSKLNRAEEILEDMQSDADLIAEKEIHNMRNYKESASDNSNTHANTVKSAISDFDMFAGCNTVEEIEKRYRALAKAYHPDTGHGDNTMFTMLQEQYQKKKTR